MQYINTNQDFARGEGDLKHKLKHFCSKNTSVRWCVEQTSETKACHRFGVWSRATFVYLKQKSIYLHLDQSLRANCVTKLLQYESQLKEL